MSALLGGISALRGGMSALKADMFDAPEHLAAKEAAIPSTTSVSVLDVECQIT